MSVIFKGVEMPTACCFVDGEHSAFAHFEFCKFYNICEKRDTIKTNCKPSDCPVKALEQEPRWIPVEEKLPEPDVEVLVTDDAGGLATISTDSIYESEVTGEKKWYTSQNVTAWMALPQAYREVKE